MAECLVFGNGKNDMNFGFILMGTVIELGI